MNTVKDFQLPFYARVSIFLLGLIALLTILYIGRSIIVPLVFSVIIAILLQPIVKLFVRFHLNRVVAILIALLMTLIVIAAFGALFISQANRFSESWPQLVENFTVLLNQSISNISEYFDISPQTIHEWISKNKSEVLDTSSAAIGKTLINVGTAIMVMLLVPVYIFLILYYEPLLINFIRKLFGENNQNQVGEIVTETKNVVQHYLVGLVIEAVIIATLYTTTLFILGVDYAILLGIIGSLLNVIPYVGGLVGVALPMMVALATKTNGWYAFYILAIYYFIQIIDNNYIVPKIVASKVKINALFSIVIVIAGNALWGISGMFLSIPLLAIMKVIFDRIEPLKPWGLLLGDTMPSFFKIESVIKVCKKNTSKP